jgi:hypothetical protein
MGGIIITKMAESHEGKYDGAVAIDAAIGVLLW